MKRLGPELKMPKGGDLKVPRVVSDLYWDLRDRHLLPIVALLVVAIIAAPILLNGGSESSNPGPAPITAGSAESAKDASLTVVTAQPGLRNPNKRFAHRRPTNPFKQRFTAPQVANAEANAVETATTVTGSESAESSSPSVTTVEETTVITPLPESSSESTPTPSTPNNPVEPRGPTERGGSKGGSNEGGSPPSGSETSELRYFNWTVKLQVAHTETAGDGSTRLSEPEVRESIKPMTAVPGVKTPVVTFIGVDPKTENALFVVSKEVTAMFGEGKCVSGTTSCEVIELEPNFPETFEYGHEHIRWKLKVIATKLVEIEDPTARTSSARIANAESVGSR